MFGLSTKKKMIFIAVIMLLFLIILLFLNPTSILFLPKTFESFNNNIFKLNFLTKQQASNVFSDPKKFPIIKKFQIKETIVRTNYHNSYIDRTDLQNKALQLYKNKVKNFTQEEINILTKNITQLRENVSKFNRENNFRIPVMKEWNFIKLCSSMDWGFPYTIDKYIVLPSNFMDWQKRDLVSTLFHEQFHVYQRKFPKQFTELYKSWGFQKIQEPTIPKDIQRRLITNPDAPYIDYAFKIKANKYLVPFLMLNSLDSHASRGLIYNKINGKLILESSNMIDLKKYNHYYIKFYKSKQPYHPHEIFATVTQKFVFNNLYFTKEDTQLWRNFFFTNLQFFKNL
jgi:hypothetical protein